MLYPIDAGCNRRLRFGQAPQPGSRSRRGKPAGPFGAVGGSRGTGCGPWDAAAGSGCGSAPGRPSGPPRGRDGRNTPCPASAHGHRRRTVARNHPEPRPPRRLRPRAAGRPQPQAPRVEHRHGGAATRSKATRCLLPGFAWLGSCWPNFAARPARRRPGRCAAGQPGAAERAHEFPRRMVAHLAQASQNLTCPGVWKACTNPASNYCALPRSTRLASSGSVALCSMQAMPNSCSISWRAVSRVRASRAASGQHP
jgi:hypothetical protein